jgi:hypothetical protein
MTPRISLITAVAAAALAVGVPAAFGDNWGADRQAGLSSDTVAMLDARERSMTEKSNVQPANGTRDHFIANDNRFRVTPVSDEPPVSATGSGTDIEWPQIGLGAMFGIALALGLIVVVRTTRSRELAH